MIFAIDGAEDFGGGYLGDLGAYSSGVASLQTALIALGQKTGDATLSALVLDGLIGPKTTAATNRAFAMYVQGAPANYATGTLTQAQVGSNAAALAQYISAEATRRGGAVAKPATGIPVSKAAVLPAVSDNSTQIVKWAAIGLGGVVVASVLYYIWKLQQGGGGGSRRTGRLRGADDVAQYDVVKIRKRAAELLGWSLADTYGVSLAMLREMVQDKSPKLAHEISAVISSGSHIYRRAPKRRRRGGFGDFGMRGNRINDRERELWVMNDEGLYRWYQSERRMKGGIRGFIRRHRAEIDAAIQR